MITRDDSRTTYEYPKHYIIYSHFDWWSLQKYFTTGGKLIEEGFEYDSGENSQWLTVEDLRCEMSRLGLYDYCEIKDKLEVACTKNDRK